MSRYLFKCKQCGFEDTITASPNDIYNIETYEQPLCSSCNSKMNRVFLAPKIKQFKGLITPKTVVDENGKTHKLSQNLWRI
jgi:predicted nucleic acid-binding Zn ribbon protein